MGVSVKNGWGFQNSLQPVTKVVGGANVVVGNVGVAIQVIAAGPLRLSKLSWRVDLAPDVAVGTVIVPVYWRLVIFAGDLPADVSAFQAQAYAGGSHPEIPSNLSYGAPLPILYDEWFDFSAGDLGLNRVASVEFPDAGPSVGGGEKLTAMLVPILDTTIPSTIVGAANALMTIGAWGLGQTASPNGGSGNGSSGDSRSLPRFDVGR